MKGSLRVVRVSDHPSRTNFDDWSDPQYKLPRKSVQNSSSDESLGLLQTSLSEISLKPTESNTSLEVNDVRDKIRKGYPLLSKKEIRNFRLPFYESLLLNLQDDGFILTYEFIKDLIAVDDAFHKELETDFNLKKRPFLKHTEKVLVPLSNGLMKAETSKLNEEKTQEATAFLDLAMLFCQSDNPSWHWIAQEMFEQCMEVIDNVEKPVDLQLKATSKFFYASFLFNEIHSLSEAKTHCECSMAISESKYWTIGDTKGKKGETLYFESCVLLHKIYLEMAENEMIGQNIEEAIQFCRNGLLWAKVINSKTAEADALWKLINIYLTVQQLYSVPELLQSYMKLCTELNNHDGLCEGYILCARYHDSVGEKGNVIEDMKKLLQIAKENHITKMEAMAHHKLATYCLLRGAQKQLLEHAIEAYMSYLNLKKNTKELEEARCLVGIAQALEVATEYCNLIPEAECYNLIDLGLLFRWKNLRIPFFDKTFVLIPEIEENMDLWERAEGKRAEEFLAHIHKWQSELTALSKRRSSAVAGSILKSSTSTSGASQTTLVDRNYTQKDQSLVTSVSKQSEDTQERSISFLDGPTAARSISAIVQNQ